MFYFVFYHLTRFEHLKKYKNIFRCEEILKVISLNTHRFSEKSAEKVVFHRSYQTCLIIFGGEIGGEIGEKIGRFLIRKIGGVTPHRFSCHTYRFFFLKSANYHWFFYLSLSLEIGEKNRLVGIMLYRCFNLSSCVRRLLPKINIIVFCLWKGLKAGFQ